MNHSWMSPQNKISFKTTIVFLVLFWIWHSHRKSGKTSEKVQEIVPTKWDLRTTETDPVGNDPSLAKSDSSPICLSDFRVSTNQNPFQSISYHFKVIMRSLRIRSRISAKYQSPVIQISKVKCYFLDLVTNIREFTFEVEKGPKEGHFKVKVKFKTKIMSIFAITIWIAIFSDGPFQT